MSWRRLTAVEDNPAPPWMPVVCEGGRAVVTMDGEVVYDPPPALEYGANAWKVEDVEAAARHEPDHDWQIRVCGDVYQRQDGVWQLVQN